MRRDSWRILCSILLLTAFLVEIVARPITAPRHDQPLFVDAFEKCFSDNAQGKQAPERTSHDKQQCCALCAGDGCCGPNFVRVAVRADIIFPTANFDDLSELEELIGRAPAHLTINRFPRAPPPPSLIG